MLSESGFGVNWLFRNVESVCSLDQFVVYVDILMGRHREAHKYTN